MVDHPRLPFGPRRLAVYAGTGGKAGREAFGEIDLSRRRRHALRWSSPAKAGEPVRGGFSAYHQRLWNGSSAGACHRAANWPTRWRTMTIADADASSTSSPVQELQRVNR